MKKRTVVKIVSFSLGLCAVFLGLWLTQRAKTESCRMQLGLSYEQAAQQLSSSLWDIDTDLEKLQYANDCEACSKLAVSLMGRAQTAKTALSHLPHAEELSVVNRFLSQVGNYAVWLTDQRKNAVWDESVYTTLSAMQQTAASIGSAVDETVYDENRMDDWSRQVEDSINRHGIQCALADRLLSTEESLTDYPTLLYDGPYSDHTDTTERPLLDQSQTVPIEQARTLAMELFGFDEEVQNRADTTGTIPGYVLGDTNAELTVSIKGGYPVRFRRYRALQQEQLTVAKAGQIADAFLERCGYDGMVQTYYELGDGLYTFCYAYLEGDTVCYADLIKVGVAADNGEVMLLTADGYLMHHRPREIPTPTVSAEDAMTSLTPGLTVIAQKQVFIPKETGGEVLCYEFSCTAENGRHLLLYLNTVDGKQEDLFLIEENPNGTFVK